MVLVCIISMKKSFLFCSKLYNNTDNQFCSAFLLYIHQKVYGAGIYMAANSQESLGYCGQSRGWERSLMSAHVHCLALCEVINDVKDPFPFYVVPEAEKITTRYLFVLPANNGGFPSVKALALESSLPKSIAACSMWDGITIERNTCVLIVGSRGSGRTTLLEFLKLRYEEVLPIKIADDWEKHYTSLNTQKSEEGFIICTHQLKDIPPVARKRLNYIFYTGSPNKTDRDTVWKYLHENTTFQHLSNMRFNELCTEMTAEHGIVTINVESGNITRVQV
jgi:hypothetical protein